MREVSVLLEARDFEGAEVLLANALGTSSPTIEAFVHLQFARLYRAWNKLTSALDHLHRAAELPNVDGFVRLAIASDLELTRGRRQGQRL